MPKSFADEMLEHFPDTAVYQIGESLPPTNTKIFTDNGSDCRKSLAAAVAGAVKSRNKEVARDLGVLIDQLATNKHNVDRVKPLGAMQVVFYTAIDVMQDQKWNYDDIMEGKAWLEKIAWDGVGNWRA
jgi:hypothetical protein